MTNAPLEVGEDALRCDRYVPDVTLMRAECSPQAASTREPDGLGTSRMVVHVGYPPRRGLPVVAVQETSAMTADGVDRDGRSDPPEHVDDTLAVGLVWSRPWGPARPVRSVKRPDRYPTCAPQRFKNRAETVYNA